MNTYAKLMAELIEEDDIIDIVKFLCERIDELEEKKKDKEPADIQRERINKKVGFSD